MAVGRWKLLGWNGGMNAVFPEVEGWFTSEWTPLHAVASNTNKTVVAVAKHLRRSPDRWGGSPSLIVRDIGYH